jgi:hypothetical protein
VIVYPLGEQSLHDRLKTRIPLATALEYTRQMLEGMAHAHRRRVIHCDIKPDNILIFSGNRIRLTDFGIAKVAQHTLDATGSGTLGYIAPEQAMGKPSFRSDVFSLGLVIYQMLSGKLPEWPYEWPPRGYDRLRRHFRQDMLTFLRRSFDMNPRRRFRDAAAMLTAFRRLRPRALRQAARPKKRRRTLEGEHWQEVRRRQFLRLHRRELEIRGTCPRCGGPVGESMQVCPWCRRSLDSYRGETRFPRRCPRCKRGMKSDWIYCAWCYGPAIGPSSDREYPDARYIGRCTNRGCPRKELMPFMRYCPWCRRKVRRRWPVEESRERCSSCGGGVYRSFWNYCPWCGRPPGAKAGMRS